MECDICCGRHDTKRKPFLCAVDARNRVYDLRMKNVHLLVENETLQRQINQLLTDTKRPTKDAMDAAFAQQRLAEDRTDQILAAADRLRDEIKGARDEVRAKRAALARRRSDLASVADGLPERRARQQKEVDKSTQMVNFRWSQSAEDMARTRAFLCTEAVKLYGLKRTRKGNSGRYEYSMGKVPVVDLTSMDSLSPEVISTSLGHMSHILMLAAHYLAIRLPAEIILPHRNYPQPTIFNLPTSYQHGTVSFPSTPSSTTLLAEARTGDSQHAPRPRPLFIHKPLQQLSKEDPAAYSFFLEGVTLLAYDVAWLCCSQGVSIGDKGSFEDICHMGRNLHSLLLDTQLQAFSNNVVNPPSRNINGGTDSDDHPTNWIGRYSHGTMFYFLGGAEGTDFVKTFKLPSPMKLADKLKKKLLGDAPAADWEVLEDDAWKVEDVPEREEVTEPRKALPDKVRPSDDNGSPRTGSNGWMKVKSRG